MIWFPLVIAVSEQDMSGIKPGPLGWYTSNVTNELQEVWLHIDKTETETFRLSIVEQDQNKTESLVPLVNSLKKY